jgi:hypothetical protein
MQTDPAAIASGDSALPDAKLLRRTENQRRQRARDHRAKLEIFNEKYLIS